MIENARKLLGSRRSAVLHSIRVVQAIDPAERLRAEPNQEHRPGIPLGRPTTNVGWWRFDIGLRVQQNERLARDAYSKLAGKSAFADPHRRLGPLPGLLDQQRAAEERIWYVRTVRQLARCHYRECVDRGVHLRRFAVTIVPARWMVPVDGFDADVVAKLIPKWRAQAQRWARQLPADSFVAGMLEAALVEDEKHGARHWSFHLHLLVYLPHGSDLRQRQWIREAFTPWANEQLGVRRPRSTREIRATKGGVRGWLRYASKGLQLHAVQSRYTPFNPETGRRMKACKRQELSPETLAPLAALYAQLRADDLMIWVGHRRYGDRVVPIDRD